MKKDMTSNWFVLYSAFRLIAMETKWFVLTMLSSIIFFFTPLFLAMVTREIFDTLSGTPNYSFSISTLIWAIPIGYAIEMITEMTFSLFVHKFNLSNTILLRKNMLSGVLQQPGADALLKSPGEAISRFRGDIESIVWFTSLIADISAFMLFAITAFFLMISINVEVTIITFVPFIAVVMIINLSSRWIIKYNDRSRSAAGRVTGAVGESFGAIQAIKVASAEEHVFEHFRELNDKRRIAAVKDTSLQAAIRSFGQVIVSIGTGVILLIAATLMQSGEFTIGDFTLFVFLLGWLTGFITFLGEFLAWFQRNRVSFARILMIMQGTSGSPTDTALLQETPLYLNQDYPKIPALEHKDSFKTLEVRNLRYRYRDSENGISDVNLKFERGSFNVIIGRVGSGKTTLLRAILGLLPAEGEVLWNGEKIDPQSFMKPPRVAYTSQVPTLFSESISKNILMGLPSESVDIQKAISTAVIDDEIKEFEQGVDTMVGPRGVRLSGGQRHRLAAARMFVREPEILCFDDLSSALDVDTEEKLWEGLFEQPGKTFIVTSHRKFVLQRADRIIIIDNGRVVDQGTLKELLDRSELMNALWKGKMIESKMNSEKPQ